jgi:hypothetical protein
MYILVHIYMSHIYDVSYVMLNNIFVYLDIIFRSIAQYYQLVIVICVAPIVIYVAPAATTCMEQSRILVLD